MLRDMKNVLETYYYDKNFKGIDIDVKFKEATEKIKKLETNAQIFRVIAGVLLEFDDSHTTFYPPGRSNRVEYGFSMQMIGNDCFLTDGKKESVYLSARNLPDVSVLPFGDESVYDVLWAHTVVIERSAHGEEPAKPKRSRKKAEAEPGDAEDAESADAGDEEESDA